MTEKHELLKCPLSWGHGVLRRTEMVTRLPKQPVKLYQAPDTDVSELRKSSRVQAVKLGTEPPVNGSFCKF
jgi:hypothetical protein